MSEASNGSEPRSRIRELIDNLIRRSRSRTDVLEDVAEDLAEQERSGPLDQQHRMVLAAVRFNEKLRAGDVMTPRADIAALEASSTLADIAHRFADTQHSRMPIYRETLDDPIGFVHVKDVLALLAPDGEGQIKAKLTDRVLPRLKREILFVPPSMPLPSLLVKMRTQRTHMALVIDEYGGTDGLISIEDIVEQIVGDIEDEYDVEDGEAITARVAGIFEVDGRARVDELERRLGGTLELPDNNDVETAAGLVAALVGRVPERGEVLRHPAGFDFEILDADPRKVKRLRIKPAPPAAEAP
jgi:CBS domain containing-hemolysin-like protein